MIKENRFQSYAMQLALRAVGETKHNLIIRKRELKTVCSHLFPNGVSARQIALDMDYCCLCEADLGFDL